MTDKVRCQATSNPKDRWDSFHPQQCQKNAVVERNGKWYCKIHDPVYIKQKNDASMQKWEEKWKAEEHKHHMQRLAPELLEALEKLAADYEKIANNPTGNQLEIHPNLVAAKALIAKAKEEK